MLIESYLDEIQQRKPSPTFAYELVYGKEIKGWRTGRYLKPHESRLWNGVEVDAHLKDKWLHDLNNIKEIEIRGSCEGHEKDWITYISFRFKNKKYENKEYLDRVVTVLSSNKYTFAGWDIGMENRPRIVVASSLYYGHPKQKEWEKWWDTLAFRIQKTL